MIEQSSSRTANSIKFKVVDYKTMKQRILDRRKRKDLLWPGTASYQAMYAGILALEIDLGVFWAKFPKDHKDSGYVITHEKYEYKGKPDWRRYALVPAGALHSIVCSLSNSVTNMPIWFENDRVDLDYLLLMVWILKPAYYFYLKTDKTPIREVITVGQDRFVVLAKKKVISINDNLMRKLTNLVACKTAAVESSEKIAELKRQVLRITDSLLQTDMANDPHVKSVIDSWKESAEKLSSRENILTSIEYFQKMYDADPHNYPFSNGSVIKTPRPCDPTSTSGALASTVSKKLDCLVRFEYCTGKLSSEVPKTPGILDEPDNGDITDSSVDSETAELSDVKIPHKLKSMINAYNQVVRERGQLKMETITEMLDSYWTFDPKISKLVPSTASSFKIPKISSKYIRAFIEADTTVLQNKSFDKGKLRVLTDSVRCQKKRSFSSLLDMNAGGDSGLVAEVKALQVVSETDLAPSGLDGRQQALLQRFEADLLMALTVVIKCELINEICELMAKTQLLLPPLESVQTCMGVVVNRLASQILEQETYATLGDDIQAMERVTRIKVAAIQNTKEDRYLRRETFVLHMTIVSIVISLFIDGGYLGNDEENQRYRQVKAIQKSIQTQMGLVADMQLCKIDRLSIVIYRAVWKFGLTILATFTDVTGTIKRGLNKNSNNLEQVELQSRMLPLLKVVGSFITKSHSEQRNSYLAAEGISDHVAILCSPFIINTLLPKFCKVSETNVCSIIMMYYIYELFFAATMTAGAIVASLGSARVSPKEPKLSPTQDALIRNLQQILVILDDVLDSNYSGNIIVWKSDNSVEQLLSCGVKPSELAWPLPNFLDCCSFLLDAMSLLVSESQGKLDPLDAVLRDEAALQAVYKNLTKALPEPQAELVKLLGFKDYFSLDSQLATAKQPTLSLGIMHPTQSASVLFARSYCKNPSVASERRVEDITARRGEKALIKAGLR